MPEEPIRRIRGLDRGQFAAWRLRTLARDATVWLLARWARPPRDRGWIRFPYYHHVFDDERDGFARQLRYMRDLGEFVSLDDALKILESDHPIDGRYFCLSFDDGFRNCLTNAVPILLDRGASAAFFLPTSYIGTAIDPVGDTEKLRRIYPHRRAVVEFLDWDEARQLAGAGMTVGSHTVNHHLLIDLSPDEAEAELRVSKQVLERELGTHCEHFCAPYGRPGIDFVPERDPAIARRVGYRSFLTTQRGSAYRRPQPMALERDHMLANWELYHLRYFLGR